MNALLDGLRLAWGTLTAIPGPAPRRVDRRVAAVAMASGWLVVLPVTLAASGLGRWLLGLGIPPLGAGLVTVAALALATRGIHSDGLADTADGLGSGRPREQALEIMRRGDVGPMGVVALVLVCAGQATLLGDLLARPWGWLIGGLALAIGRLALADACSRGVPAARSEGLGSGVAGAVPSGLGPALTVAVFVGGMGLLNVLDTGAGAGAADGGALDAVTPGAWAWGVVAGTALSRAVLVAAVRRLGGITGDVLGAMVELMALGMLLGLAVR